MNDRIQINKICPCCFRDILNDEADMFIRDSDVRFNSPIYNDLITPKQDEKYMYFWDAMGGTLNVTQYNRIVITNSIIKEKNEELLLAKLEPIEKKYDPTSKGYELTIKGGSIVIVTNTMLCPHCHNVLPQNFWNYDMYRVGLAGSVAAGKTVFLSTLMINGFRVLNRDTLFVRNAHGDSMDSNKMEMERIAELLRREQICPDPTNKAFMPPIYLEIAYKNEECNKTFLLAIYDVAGEMIRRGAGAGKTTFARHMDGIICFTDPSAMLLDQPIPLKKSLDEGKILAECRLLTKEEQIAVQRKSNEEGKKIMYHSSNMVTAEEDEDFLYERRLDTILDSIRTGIGDNQLKNINIALTIAKCDLLEDLEEIKEVVGHSLLFQREELHRGWINQDHHLLRQYVLDKVFEQKVFHLQRNLAEYKSSALFCISALGCETHQVEQQQMIVTKAVRKIDPIRVEEPLMWLLMKYMKERRWIL